MGLVQRIIIRMVKVKVMLSMPKKRREKGVYWDEGWSTEMWWDGWRVRLEEVADRQFASGEAQLTGHRSHQDRG